MRGADLLSQAMAASGVETVFSLSGNQIMPLYDALLEPHIRIVHTRHESAAVFMADAWAQLTGSTGVALVTAAPGFANALGALYSASMAESPVVFLAGDSPVAADGQRAFQEFSQCAAVAPFVKHTERVLDARQLPAAWQRAVDIAHHGTPGPVHIALPFDVLGATMEQPVNTVDPANSDTGTTIRLPILRAQTEEVMQLHYALTIARKPLIVTGPALNNTRHGTTLDQLQQHMATPVIAMESPRGLADPALGALRDALLDADCVVLMGKKPDFTLGFAAEENLPAERLFVVEPDIDQLQHSLQVLADRSPTTIHAAPTQVISQLLNMAPVARDDERWATQVDACLQQRVTIDTHESDQGMHPAQVVGKIAEAMEQCDEPILVCDGGEFGQWAQAFSSSATRIINGPSGAIGGGLCYAIAAGIARPEATVFVLMGDGTAGFHFAEFETSVRESAGIIAIIGNDSCWNAEHQIQLRDYGAQRTHACTLGENIRYDQAATGLGTTGAFVDTSGSLQAALKNAMQSSKQGVSTCINARLNGLPAPTV